MPAAMQSSKKKAKLVIPRKKGTVVDGDSTAGREGASVSPASPDLGGHQRSPEVVSSSKSVTGVGSRGRDCEANGVVGVGRHAKYDADAQPPWRGGEVKPYLYGRKVVFILGGRRQPPLYR